MPSREQIEQIAHDVTALWAAESTSEKDRKRLSRALIADVTLSSKPGSRELRVGIRWRSGATEEHSVQRPQKPAEAKRTPSEVIGLIKRLGGDHTNAEIAAELEAAGLLTSTGLPFDEKAVRWLRWRYKIASSPRQPLQDGELTVAQVAEGLGISHGAVYYWISHGQLQARRATRGRPCIPFDPDVEQECRQRVANSVHIIPTETKITAAGGAV